MRGHFSRLSVATTTVRSVSSGTRISGSPNAEHLDEFVEESPIGCVLLHFETQENDVLMERVALF